MQLQEAPVRHQQQPRLRLLWQLQGWRGHLPLRRRWLQLWVWLQQPVAEPLRLLPPHRTQAAAIRLLLLSMWLQ